MAKQKIGVKITGLETEADRAAFTKACADFWMQCISEKISSLPISHEAKLAFAAEVVEEIHRKGELLAGATI